MHTGLRKEDILIENADITEALSRLPKQERLDREFRFKRAFDASGHNDFLPKRAWLTQEEADKVVTTSPQVTVFGVSCLGGD